MKIFRNIILASGLALAALSVASCDIGKFGKETKHGDGDAVVGFAKDTYSFKESAGIVRVPVEVTGSPLDYPSTFDVKAEAINLADLAQLSDLVLFTQTTDFKDYGNGTIYVEFKITDDAEINDDRSFKLTIVNAQGAKLADLAETTVIIKDNDNNPYEKLWGDWTFHGLDYGLAPAEFTVSISGGFTEEEQEANADKLLVCWGIMGYKWSDNTPVWYLAYDADAKLLSLVPGKQLTVPGAVDWGAGGNQWAETWYWNPATGESSDSIQLTATWSEDLKTITFDQTGGFVLRIFNEGGYLGVWDRFSKITLTR